MVSENLTDIGTKFEYVNWKHKSRVRWIDGNEWENYIRDHKFSFTTFYRDVLEITVPFTFFHVREEKKWKMYCERLHKDGYKLEPYTQTYEEYCDDCDEIHDTLINYDYNMFKIRKNVTFRSKEYGQLVALIKDIYRNGTYNYSTYYVCNPWVREKNRRPYEVLWFDMHPGKHLNFVRGFLGLPIEGWFSYWKGFEDHEQWHKIKSKIKETKEIKTIEEIEKIAPYPIQSCFIETIHKPHKPGIFLKVPHKDWKVTDEIGHHKWPDLGMYYGESGDTLFKEEMEIIDDVINSDNKIETMKKYVKILRNFDTETLTINNFIAFILCELEKDNNFERIQNEM